MTSTIQEDVIDRLSSVSAAHVADALERQGQSNFVMSPRVRLVGSSSRTSVVGTATILELCRARTDRDPRGLGHFLDEDVAEGSFVVIACHGESTYVPFGERAATRARAVGAVGAVVDGPVRDVDELRSMGWPVFSTSIGLLASEGHLARLRVDQPTVCGGVRVESGDVLVGDASGVVVVPHALAEETARLASERHEIDRSSLEDIREGETLKETHRHFHDDDLEHLHAIDNEE